MALSLAQINRIASLATIPLMLLAILAFSRAAGREPEIPLPSEGTVVIASLRAESLTFHNFATGRATTLALPGPPHELLALDARLYVTLGRANLVAEIGQMQTLLAFTPQVKLRDGITALVQAISGIAND